MQGIKEKYVGNIKRTNPESLKLKLSITGSCLKCEDYELCGGRCLYSNLYPAWPKIGINEICLTTKHLINEMKRIQPEIEKLIKNKKINKKDFDFLKYNCCEIIP
jgi:sulfatase maturation enzyme AslB (radical SAM superfamily)